MNSIFPESMTLSILRLIGEELRKDRTSRVIAQVPVDVATYLFNEKREWLRTLEDKSEIELLIVPNEHMQTPDYVMILPWNLQAEIRRQLDGIKAWGGRFVIPVPAAAVDP